MEKIADWMEEKKIGRRSTHFSYAIGLFRASVIGARRYRLFIAINAARWLCRRRIYRYYFRIMSLLNPRVNPR
jgi:hypothetical protein